METGEYKVYGYRWIALAVFALVQASIQVLWSSLLPITSEAAQFYGVSALMIGLLSMLFMFVYVFVSLPSSWAISAFGVRKGMGFGVVLMGVFGLVRGFFGHNYTIVLIATVMLSIAQPFIINSITTMSARWFPVHERATATGIAMLAQFIGIMGGMAVSPILAGSLGIKTMLTWYGVLAFTALVLFFMLYREKPLTPPSASEKEDRFMMREGLKHVFKTREGIFLLIIFTLGLAAFNTVSTWIEQIIIPRGFNSMQAGTLGGIMMVAGILGCIVLPILSDKTRRRKPYLLLGVAMIVPGLLGLTYVQTLTSLLLAGAVIGFCQL
ncbi:MAG: MFS transporter, partial [Deltaproteobacteria bacterium]|nr:MFS transporter [Deltaproteobacteria bacterium]